MEPNELVLRLTELAIDYPNDDWLGLTPEDRVDSIVSIYQTFQHRLAGLGEAEPREKSRMAEPILVAENLNPDDLEAA